MAGLYEEQILGAQQSKDLARKLRETEIPSTGHMITTVLSLRQRCEG